MTRTLPDRLARGEILQLAAVVTHRRRGGLRHAFRYGADYLLLAPERAAETVLVRRNRAGLFSVHDRDHGGRRGTGRGAPWAWERLAEAGLPRRPDMVLGLLTQPRCLGYWFNPVSFWLLWQGTELRAVIAEVNNTFGQRHSYLCARPGFAPIRAGDMIRAQKMFHVSPFQQVAGHYDFRFDLDPERAALLIRHVDGDNGLVAAMTGRLRRATTPRLVRAALRRPGGAMRVIVLIYWQALRLKLKGAAYRPVPPTPDQEISR
ncbi:DUF1365 domain-containing protein [Pseudodonghicola flavimaris]|uniref:DUF1365 domain-containing protein n=1 Tax=Pseudodonghicola flavimaris TaxID=3050036 RepID=A0ABT7F1V7_9RHOB|nr:DUF1365 domain-containing protein [Pseudodonghicola flavimaris]MDK3018589.1 DUF1365 domain-containing protein [Pseudodonghicola flavimaris]